VLARGVQLRDERADLVPGEVDLVRREVAVRLVKVDIVPLRCEAISYCFYTRSTAHSLSSGMFAARMLCTAWRVSFTEA
jgi:hypothetical protein